MGLDLGRALERTGDGMAVVDVRHRIVGWNDAARRLLGYAARDVEGRPCCTVFNWSDRHGNAVCGPGCVNAAAADAQGLIPNQQVVGTRSDGTRVWLDVSTVVLPSELRSHGVLVHFFREAALPAELLRLAEVAATRPPAVTPASSDLGLTPREREVLALLADGLSTRAAAARLGISPATVRNHVQHALAKLGVRTRAAAVARLLGTRL